MRRLTLATTILSCLALGCDDTPPVTTGPTNNPNIQVDFLFENDGVKVYRFYVDGRYRYYADARGGVMSEHTRSTTISNGKTATTTTTTHQDDIPTAGK